MPTTGTETTKSRVSLQPVDAGNWRHVAGLEVSPEQREYVMAPSYYLALCHYGGLWQPLAVTLDNQVIGFLMWAVDVTDGSCWLGGITIDRSVQGNGYGRQTVLAAVDKLAREQGHRQFALSYLPANAIARRLYQSLGFVETGETEDEELVARLTLGDERPVGG